VSWQHGGLGRTHGGVLKWGQPNSWMFFFFWKILAKHVSFVFFFALILGEYVMPSELKLSIVFAGYLR
jgi:hypothetical protein